MDCIFCKIINGEIPSFKIYEDEMFIVILDRFPASDGHSLIIPKNHVTDMFGLSPSESKAIIPLAQKLGEKICKTLNADGLNIIQNNGKAAGQAVFHYHMHLIPRFNNDNVKTQFAPTEPTLEDLSKIEKLLLA